MLLIHVICLYIMERKNFVLLLNFFTHKLLVNFANNYKKKKIHSISNIKCTLKVYTINCIQSSNTTVVSFVSILSFRRGSLVETSESSMILGSTQ